MVVSNDRCSGAAGVRDEEGVNVEERDGVGVGTGKLGDNVGVSVFVLVAVAVGVFDSVRK